MIQFKLPNVLLVGILTLSNQNLIDWFWVRYNFCILYTKYQLGYTAYLFRKNVFV